MRTVSVTLYKFDELNDEAKAAAINWYRQGALDYDWWESTYEDAKSVGLQITEFDVDRYCKGKFLPSHSAKDCAVAIVREHGPDCETRGDAEIFLAARGRLSDVDDLDDCDREFLRTLLEDYRIILRDEEEYLTSDEQCAQAIRANEYGFTENGRRGD